MYMFLKESSQYRKITGAVFQLHCILFTLYLEKLIYICISFLLWAVISLTAVLFICTICTV